MAPKPHCFGAVKIEPGFPMYPVIESSESATMRRHRRRPNWFAILAGFSAAKASATVSLIHEADQLESVYGDDAVAFVREQVQAADRKARKHLYRLHDELARRRRRNASADDLAMA
jgi:hypothetical protein